MQPSETSSTSEPPTVILPRPVINLALRVVQLMTGVDSLALQVIRLDGAWYLITQGGKLERLG